jgi:hypothetical protein
MTGPGEPVYPAISSCPTTSPVGFALGYRVAIYDETDTHAPVLLGVAQPVANLRGVYSFTFPNALNDGGHFILAKVQLIDPGNVQIQRATANCLCLSTNRSPSLRCNFWFAAMLSPQ